MPHDDTWSAYRFERAPRPDPRLLWAGGLATAIVAALIAFVGTIVARAILDIPLIGDLTHGVVWSVNTPWLCAWSAVAAIAATALLHVLLLTTPRPHGFFGWIVGLVTVATAVHPFTIELPLETRVATSVLTVFLGLAIGILLSGVAAAALRRR